MCCVTCHVYIKLEKQCKEEHKHGMRGSSIRRYAAQIAQDATKKVREKGSQQCENNVNHKCNTRVKKETLVIITTLAARGGAAQGIKCNFTPAGDSAHPLSLTKHLQPCSDP